jgi:homoserine O-acetyltransferase
MAPNNQLKTNQLKTATISEDANGVKTFTSPTPFEFELGDNISPLTLVYETYGELSPAKDNVILIHHALSTSSHIASHEKNPEKGWWEAMIGPDKAIDTQRFYVICINNLGSCFGSSGPASINPETNKPYCRDFPALTINDMVRSQYLFLENLGIKKLYAVVGNSMGAMLSLTFCILYPEMVEHLISVSSCYKSYPVSIATHAVQQEIIAMDPEWKGGYYQQNPTRGFNIARKFGLLSYRHPGELNSRFIKEGDLREYLDYNAKKFTAKFDLNCYLYLQDAMDSFDVTAGHADPCAPFKKIKAKVLVMSVSSDLLFPAQQQRDLYEQLKAAKVKVDFVEHDSDYGHDAFYADQTISAHIEKFLA